MLLTSTLKVWDLCLSVRPYSDANYSLVYVINDNILIFSIKINSTIKLALDKKFGVTVVCKINISSGIFLVIKYLMKLQYNIGTHRDSEFLIFNILKTCEYFMPCVL